MTNGTKTTCDRCGAEGTFYDSMADADRDPGTTIVPLGTENICDECAESDPNHRDA
mgnify:CR=1 FL=1